MKNQPHTVRSRYFTSGQGLYAFMLVITLVFSNYSFGQSSKRSANTVDTSLYAYLYAQEEVSILIESESLKWVTQSELEAYHPITVHIGHSGAMNLSGIPARIRARGGIRKTRCHLPPVKIDFKKSMLDSLGLGSHDKLKLVLPCSDGKMAETLLKKEYFVYELYHLVDTNGLKARLVDVVIENKGKAKYELKAILLEDEAEYSRRKRASVIEKGHVNSTILDRNCFVKMVFFQYMIANTDWSVADKHNLEIIGVTSESRIFPVPYDFDYSGFVGHTYAVPYETLPIDNVHDRYFFPYEMTKEEFNSAVAFFLSKENEFYQYCDRPTYLDTKDKELNRVYISSFFDHLRKPDRLIKYVNIKN